MTKVLKAVALWLAIALVVWLITIWRWQSTGHDASTAEIVGQLFVLPVALAAALLAAIWGVKRLREQAASPIAAPVPKAAAKGANQAAASQPAEADRPVMAWVMAEALMLSAGSEAVAVLDGLRAHAVRPELDAQLQDLDGLPVFTARVPDLGLDDWLDAHAELAPAREAGMSDEVVRALALIEGPLHHMLEAVGALVPPDGKPWGYGQARGEHEADAPAASHLSGVAVQVPKSVSVSREAMAPQLTIRLILPAHWPQAERDAAVDWLRSQCGSLLDWAEATQAKGVRWVADALEQPEGIWDAIDRCMVQWSRQTRPELMLMLAVDSAINEASVERMQGRGELFTSTHQTGKVPGEGAVALLLANEQWPDPDGGEQLPVRMWRPVRARRDKSADAAGRIGATVLSAALTQAMSLNKADKAQLLVVADADHRASRTGELFEALQEAVPGLDPMLAVARLGEACGELGLVRALAPSALACAALRAGEASGQVAWATHVQSSHDRVVVALAPWVQPAAVA